MKKLSLSIVTALVFFVVTAMAQTTPATDPQGSTPTTASPSNQTSTQAQAPAAQPGASTSATPAAGQSATTAEPKGEKKLKGCIESENGKFVLEAKHGKEITLTGQDVSAHVGHVVVVHGNFQDNMAASASGETAGTAAATSSTSTSASGTTTGSADKKSKAGKEFNVSSVEMVSATCKDRDKATEKHDKSSTQPPQ